MRIHWVRDTLGLSGGWMQQVKGALAGAVVATGFNGLWKSIHTRHEATPPPAPWRCGGVGVGGDFLPTIKAKQPGTVVSGGVWVLPRKAREGSVCASTTRGPPLQYVCGRGGGGEVHEGWGVTMQFNLLMGAVAFAGRGQFWGDGAGQSVGESGMSVPLLIIAATAPCAAPLHSQSYADHQFRRALYTPDPGICTTGPV